MLIPEGKPPKRVSAAPRTTPLPVGLDREQRAERTDSEQMVGWRENGGKTPLIIVRVYTPYFILTLYEYILLVIIVPYFDYTFLVYILLVSDIFFQNISS